MNIGDRVIWRDAPTPRLATDRPATVIDTLVRTGPRKGQPSKRLLIELEGVRLGDGSPHRVRVKPTSLRPIYRTKADS